MKPETAADAVDLDVAEAEAIEQPHERTAYGLLGWHRPERASGPPHRTGLRLSEASYRAAVRFTIATTHTNHSMIRTQFLCVG